MEPVESNPVIGSDIVIPNPGPVAFAMDSYVDLLAEDVECSNMLKWWEARRALVRKRISDILGDQEVGTVKGQEAVHYEYVNRLNQTGLKKKYPAMYQAYVKPVMKDEFDVEAFKATRPELYRMFQVRQMRVTFEPPGNK